MNGRLILGFLAAPLVPCILAATAASLRQGDLASIPFGTLLYALFAYPFALVLGIPTYLLISRLGHPSLVRVIFSGGILGLISGLIFLELLDLNWVTTGNNGKFTIILLFGIFGAITALVFWWLAIRPRSNPSFKGDALKRAP